MCLRERSAEKKRQQERSVKNYVDKSEMPREITTGSKCCEIRRQERNAVKNGDGNGHSEGI